MGKDKDQTKQTGSDQGSTHTKNEYQGQGSQGKGQGLDRGRGLNKDRDFTQGQGSWKQGDPTTTSEGAWNDRAQRDMQQGDRTDPPQPGGTSPLDKDQHPVNQNRPVQQNR